MPAKRDTAALNDEIRMRGVRCKGYGQLAKFVMLDPSLSIEAKGIYAYFVSYTGGGANTAFPGRDRILADLKVSKDTYYKHFNQLLQQGYITVEQKAGDASGAGFKHNLYTIESYPQDFAARAQDELSEGMQKACRQVEAARDLSAAGYGNIPKAVMLDELPLQSKALYAYLCVFSGENWLASPARDVILAHLKISHNSFDKYAGALVKKNYITKTQKVINGRFGGVVYTLVQQPESEACTPSPRFSDTQEGTVSSPESPMPKIQDTQKRAETKEIGKDDLSQPRISDTQISPAQKSYTQNPDHNKPSVTTTNVNSNKPEQDPSIPGSVESAAPAADADGWDTVFSDSVCRSQAKVQALVHEMTDWAVRSHRSSYRGEQGEVQRLVYLLFAEALTEMLSAECSPTLVRRSRIPWSRVAEAVNGKVKWQADENGDRYGDLTAVADKAVEDYMRAARKQHISNQLLYMKAVIWTVLQSFEVAAETASPEPEVISREYLQSMLDRI